MNEQDGSSPQEAAAASASLPEAAKAAITADLLRSALPECQPQEGSPANTFTDSELQELQAVLPALNLRPRENDAQKLARSQKQPPSACHAPKNKNNVLDLCELWEAPITASNNKSQKTTEPPLDSAGPQEAPLAATAPNPNDIDTDTSSNPQLDWHGAPRFVPDQVQSPREFRQRVRAGAFTGPTNAVCPGFLQCNLVVLPQGQHAFDFLLFCQRNPKACPLLEVCYSGENDDTAAIPSSAIPTALAPHADLRTDVPKYAIYRDGQLVEETTDVTQHWPANAVAFLIGCSFSYDGALLDAGIPLRSVEQGKNVPMYRTNLKCRSAGSLQGNMVVSMKPIPALQIAKHVEITSRYPHAHGGPVCIGRPDCIGIDAATRLGNPEWGDAVDMHLEDVPIFHACGVTPQSVLMDSKVPFAITHAAGHMFVTDRPSDMGV